MRHSPLITHDSRLPPTVAFVLGTRPEAIKLAPVILHVRRFAKGLRPVIVSTGQQADLVGPALADFGLTPEHDLAVMRPGQSLSDLTSNCVAGLARLLTELRPTLVVVQGDTTSALAGAMAAFYQRIAVAHVEAGLRTHDLAGPFPEEANRQMISRLASLHFAPTLDAKANLLAEGVTPERIEVTGNTVVDALELLRDRIAATLLPPELSPDVLRHHKLVLVTAHRRENLGRPLESICDSICTLARSRPELHFAFITHPNPAAGRIARERLTDQPRVTLLPPQPYLSSLRLVAASWLILTDSGGLQEEAPSFGRPVLVLRHRTERTEGIAAGAARLVGTEARAIAQQVELLCDSDVAYTQLMPDSNPYGDGQAAKRIVATLTATQKSFSCRVPSRLVRPNCRTESSAN